MHAIGQSLVYFMSENLCRAGNLGKCSEEGFYRFTTPSFQGTRNKRNCRWYLTRGAELKMDSARLFKEPTATPAARTRAAGVPTRALVTLEPWAALMGGDVGVHRRCRCGRFGRFSPFFSEGLPFCKPCADSASESRKGPTLAQGAFVKLHSLTGASRPLNGAHAELVQFARVSRKWTVKICQNGRKQRRRKLNVQGTNMTFVCAPYRFSPDTVVYCCTTTSNFIWERGRVVQTHWEDSDGVCQPYQVKLDSGRLIFAPVDDNWTIRVFDQEPLTPEHSKILAQLHDRYCAGAFKDLVSIKDQCMMVASDVQRFWPELAAEIYAAIARALETLGHFKLALELQQRNLALALLIKDADFLGVTYGEQGNLLQAMGEHAKALRALTQSLSIARELDNRREEAVALGGIGVNLTALARQREAIALFEQQLGLARQLSMQDLEANALTNLAVAHRNLGEYQAAIGFEHASLAIRADLGQASPLWQSLHSLGLIYDSMGEPDKAIAYLKQSWHEAHRAGTGHRVAEGLR